MKIRINTPKYILLVAVLLIGVTACNKLGNQHSNIEEISDNTFLINNNSDDLNTRMTYVHKPVVFSGNFKVPIPSYCDTYSWYYVSEVASPIYDGEPLSATDVRIFGDIAYVSYHRQGNIYAGGIEVIDISDPEYPVILSYMEFDDVDINTLAIDDMGTEAERRVFLAGSSKKKGAVLRQVITNNGLLNNNVIEVGLSDAIANGAVSASSNGIGLSNDYIYMTSGNSFGGTFQLDRLTLAIIANEEYSEAKAIALNGPNTGDYQVSLVGGDNGKLNVHLVGSDRTLLRSINLGPIVHQNVAEPYLGKATVAMQAGSLIAYVAVNSEGMKAVNIETGEVVYTSPLDMLTTGNTHGVAVDDRSIYLANSDDGLFIGCIPEIPEIGDNMIFVQHWDLDESGASANMVQTDGEWVFVAKGGGGLKILRKISNFN